MLKLNIGQINRKGRGVKGQSVPVETLGLITETEKTLERGKRKGMTVIVSKMDYSSLNDVDINEIEDFIISRGMNLKRVLLKGFDTFQMEKARKGVNSVSILRTQMIQSSLAKDEKKAKVMAQIVLNIVREKEMTINDVILMLGGKL